MNSPQAKEVMALNDHYFESLVNRMLTGTQACASSVSACILHDVQNASANADVTATRGTSKNANLQRQLQSIKDDITALSSK